MNSEVIFLLAAGAVLTALAVTHRAAHRDPYANFFTQLLDTWYSHWHESERRRGLHRVLWLGYSLMAVGAFVIAAVKFARSV